MQTLPLLWEAWLGRLTDERAEIVLNKHRPASTGGKKLDDYAELMRRSFAESARVLKRGGRAILAFSNSDDKVWEAIQKAVGNAGFEIDRVHLLNKGQPSIKGVKGVTGKENVTTLDLVLCLQHRNSAVQITMPFSPPLTLVDAAISGVLTGSNPQMGRRTDEVYSAVIRSVVEANYSVSSITMPWIANRCIELGATQQEGRWFLARLAANAPSGDFVEGYITPVQTLPRHGNSTPIEKPFAPSRVAGGRNSPFYLAHSYHTKVPPEAIRPFIEHYTKPGDVVLDPFCGSGMTGVAAALTGRYAILKDLSPAAIHLS